jgi:acyl carrier protein
MMAPGIELGGLSMSMLASNRGPSCPAGDILSVRIRTFIAERLGVNVDTVIVDSHFGDDLGLDLLDVVELTMLIEKEFVKREIADSNDEIEFVGDLIQHIEFYYQG